MPEREFHERGQLVKEAFKQECVNCWACLRASGVGRGWGGVSICGTNWGIMGLLHFSTLPFLLWGLCYGPRSGIRSWDNRMSSVVADPLAGAQCPDLFAAWDSSKDAQWFLGTGNWQWQPQGQQRCRQPWHVVRHEPHPSCPLWLQRPECGYTQDTRLLLHSFAEGTLFAQV